MQKKYIVVITGATATGKSDLAIRLAGKIGGEIINADIGSWYTPLTIGTAKPNWRNEPVAHHLFDIVNEPCQFGVVQFRDQVQKVAHAIWDRGNIPIVVGGSAFYIKNLWYRPHDISKFSVHQNSFVCSDDVSTLDYWKELCAIDSFRASAIHQNDRYRIVRALQLYHATNKKPSDFELVYDPVAPIYSIFCVRDRPELYERINKRVEIMIEQGWIDEVKKLLDTSWEPFLMHKKIIGYDDIISYLRGDYSDSSYQEMVALIQKKTRNYAKRQNTFLNKLYKDLISRHQTHGLIECVEETNLTLCDVGLYINGVSHTLQKIFG